MITVKVTTIFSDMVFVKSYERQESIDKKEEVKILHSSGKFMILGWKQIKNKIKKKSTKYKSKTGGQDYYLYYYDWNPVDTNEK